MNDVKLRRRISDATPGGPTFWPAASTAVHNTWTIIRGEPGRGFLLETEVVILTLVSPFEAGRSQVTARSLGITYVQPPTLPILPR